mmetsp:Transcript_14004/g.19475  ORF Transcript_14004/g.19475 Transcript_14004/m.19475 type:complete len:107 (-) Transcript_14004:16-336(-)
MQWLHQKNIDWFGSDLDLVVHYSKKLEGILDSYGATGKGLHQKTNSLESKLPADVKKDLHYIATIRNKIVHETSFQKVENRTEFIQKCQSVEQRLYQALSWGCVIM